MAENQIWPSLLHDFRKGQVSSDDIGVQGEVEQDLTGLNAGVKLPNIDGDAASNHKHGTHVHRRRQTMPETPIRLYKTPAVHHTPHETSMTRSKSAPVAKTFTPVVTREATPQSRAKSAVLPKREKVDTPKREVMSVCSIRRKQEYPHIQIDDIDRRYHEARRVHGWRAEVHGSALKCIMPRIPYAQEAISPPRKIAPKLKFGFTNDNTYFYKTIPKKTNSYVIHPNFFSERIWEKQLAHLKQYSPENGYVTIS